MLQIKLSSVSKNQVFNSKLAGYDGLMSIIPALWGWKGERRIGTINGRPARELYSISLFQRPKQQQQKSPKYKSLSSLQIF